MTSTHIQVHYTDRYSQHSSIIWPFEQNGWGFVYKPSNCCFKSCCSHLNFRIMPVSSKEFLDIKATTECRFTLKCVCDTISTPHSQMHHADKYSQHSPVIWPVWPNDWVFICELSGCGFESCCSHLNQMFDFFFSIFIS